MEARAGTNCLHTETLCANVCSGKDHLELLQLGKRTRKDLGEIVALKRWLFLSAPPHPPLSSVPFRCNESGERLALVSQSIIVIVESFKQQERTLLKS